MSTATAAMSLNEPCAEFLNRYYRDEVAQLTERRPGLEIDYADLYQFNPDLADDFRDEPESVISALQAATKDVDTPTADQPPKPDIRVYNIPDEDVYAPGQIRSDQGGQYVGIRGTLERVTSTADTPRIAAFQCQHGHVQEVPQDMKRQDLQEPADCPECTTKPYFSVNEDRTQWADYTKVRIQSRPDVDESSEGKLVGYVLDSLIDAGGEGGLFGRAGEPITAYGILRRRQKSGRGANESLFDHVLDVRAIEFDHDDNTVDVAAHRDTFEELAQRDDAVDLFAESIAPQLHATNAWDAAFEFAVAYLFGAPRIDIPQGPTYRGDLHFLIISDYGTGKSTFKEDIEAYSPKCLSKSTTALSSGVGLTAAAVKDDFGEGQWTIKPGLLVRANGGHLILDEIDKGPDELTDMNDALEGEQVVDIEKAGQSATYQSRTAVMALGNPVDGRFNANEPISTQLDISDSLLSRFDGIVTMRDHADIDQDAAVAETYGRAYTEAQETQYGDREEFDVLDRPVPVDVGQAWIKHARENVDPLLRYEQFEELKAWYAEEVRQLNQTYAVDGEGGEMPVPATVRVLAAAVKLSIAFARVHLRDDVAPVDVQRAKRLSKQLIKQNWTGESFDAAKNQGGPAFDQLKPKILDAIGEDALFTDEIARQVGKSESAVSGMLDRMKNQGRVIERKGKWEVNT